MNASKKKFEGDKNIFLSDFMHGNENAVNITKGDENSFVIAAASITAKTYRDNLMKNYAKDFPQYGFENHVGYGTKEHIEAKK
jgi:ribonuclease HII